MYEGRVSTLRQVLTAAALVLLLAPAAALAQFTVGAGGSIVNDTGKALDVNNFDTASAHVFGELSFDTWGLLQVRVSQFGLPGTAPDAPNLRVQAATVTVGYVFAEEWWKAGFYVGGGGYRVRPNSLEAGQVPADEKENVWGWTGGVISIFDITPHWDARLELAGHFLRTNVEHRPIFLTAGVGYHF